MLQLAAHKPDILHLQWFGAPEADRWLFRPRSPVVFTAHDIIPRRTAARTGLWRSLFARCDRIVVHSQRGTRFARVVRYPDRALERHPPSRVPLGRRPAGRRPHRARPRAHPPVQGHRGLGRGRPPGGRCASSRRGRPARAAGRAAAHRGRQSRVASRVPPRPRDPARALRSDGRALPVPLRDRRLGSAAPGAGSRGARNRLRHRRTRRGRRADSARVRWSIPETSAAWRSPSSSCSGIRMRSRPRAAAPRRRVPSSPGKRRRPRTSSSIESSSDVRTWTLSRARPASAGPLRRGGRRAPETKRRPPTRSGRRRAGRSPRSSSATISSWWTRSASGSTRSGRHTREHSTSRPPTSIEKPSTARR